MDRWFTRNGKVLTQGGGLRGCCCAPAPVPNRLTLLNAALTREICAAGNQQYTFMIVTYTVYLGGGAFGGFTRSYAETCACRPGTAFPIRISRDYALAGSGSTATVVTAGLGGGTVYTLTAAAFSAAPAGTVFWSASEPSENILDDCWPARYVHLVKG
jgi:hypothetical protein